MVFTLPRKFFPQLSWKMSVALVIVGLALVLPLVHYLIFKDAPTLTFYWALDLAFVPVQVLIVTVIVEHILGERERKLMLHKLNMVIGAFFSEVGFESMRRMLAFCQDLSVFQQRLSVELDWDDAAFGQALAFSKANSCTFESHDAKLGELKAYLTGKRTFVLGLLQNPNLLEHERFTDLLWALCHLMEELDARPDLANLPHKDVEHLMVDMRRAFNLLVVEWLAYMQHLKRSYPYIYSLSVRTNPFNPKAKVIYGG